MGVCAAPECDRDARLRVRVGGESIPLCRRCYDYFSRNRTLFRKYTEPPERCEAPDCPKVARNNVKVRGVWRRVCAACAKRWRIHASFDRRQGIPPDSERPPTTRHMRERAIQLRREGDSYTQIGLQLGIPKSTVWEWCRDEGLTRPRY